MGSSSNTILKFNNYVYWKTDKITMCFVASEDFLKLSINLLIFNTQFETTTSLVVSKLVVLNLVNVQL